MDPEADLNPSREQSGEFEQVEFHLARPDWKNECALNNRLTTAMLCYEQMVELLPQVSEFLSELEQGERKIHPERLTALAEKCESEHERLIEELSFETPQGFADNVFEADSSLDPSINIYRYQYGLSSVLRYVAVRIKDGPESQAIKLLEDAESLICASIYDTAVELRAAVAELLATRSFSSLSVPQFVRPLKVDEATLEFFDDEHEASVERYKLLASDEEVATAVFVDTLRALEEFAPKILEYQEAKSPASLRIALEKAAEQLKCAFDLSLLDPLIERDNQHAFLAASLYDSIDPRVTQRVTEHFFRGSDSLEFLNRCASQELFLRSELCDPQRPLISVAAQLVKRASERCGNPDDDVRVPLGAVLSVFEDVAPDHPEYPILAQYLSGLRDEVGGRLDLDKVDEALTTLALKLIESDSPTIRGSVILYLASRRVPLDQRCFKAVAAALYELRGVSGYADFLGVLSSKIYPSESHVVLSKLLIREAFQLPIDERRRVDPTKCFAATFGERVSKTYLKAIAAISGIDYVDLRFTHAFWSHLKVSGMLDISRRFQPDYLGATCDEARVLSKQGVELFRCYRRFNANLLDWKIQPLSVLVSAARSCDSDIIESLRHRGFPITLEYAQVLARLPTEQSSRSRLFEAYDAIGRSINFDVWGVLDRASANNRQDLELDTLIVDSLAQADCEVIRGVVQSPLPREGAGKDDARFGNFVTGKLESWDDDLARNLVLDHERLTRALCALVESGPGLSMQTFEVAMDGYLNSLDEERFERGLQKGDLKRLYPDLIELLTSSDAVERQVVMNLFKEKSIGELLAWSCKGEVGVIREMIRAWCQEARKTGLDASDYAFFAVKHLIPWYLMMRPEEGDTYSSIIQNPRLRLVLNIAAGRCKQKDPTVPASIWIKQYALPDAPSLSFELALYDGSAHLNELSLEPSQQGAYLEVLSQLPSGVVNEDTAHGIIESLHRSGIPIDKLASSKLVEALAQTELLQYSGTDRPLGEIEAILQGLADIVRAGDDKLCLKIAQELIEYGYHADLQDDDYHGYYDYDEWHVEGLFQQFINQDDSRQKAAIKRSFLTFVGESRSPNRQASLNRELDLLLGIKSDQKERGDWYRDAKATQLKKGHVPPSVMELSAIREFFKTFGVCNAGQLYVTFRGLFLGLNHSPTVLNRHRPSTGYRWEASNAEGEQEGGRHINSVSELVRYVRDTTRDIVENPNGFTPRSLLDLELLGLAARVYRTGELSVQQALAFEQESVRAWHEPNKSYTTKFKRRFEKFPNTQRHFSFHRIDPKQLRAFQIAPDEREMIEVFKSQISQIQGVGLEVEIENLAVHFQVESAAEEILPSIESDAREDGSGYRAVLAQLFVDFDRLGDSGSRPELLRKLFLLFALSQRMRSASARFMLEAVDAHELLCGFSEFLYQSFHDEDFSQVLERLDGELVEELANAVGLPIFGPAITRLMKTLDKTTDKVTTLTFTPGRGAPSALIGFICDSCARTHLETTPDGLFVSFSPVFEREKDRPLITNFQGGSILLAAETVDGDDALIIRGFNPIHSLLMKVRAGDLFESFVSFLEHEIARPLGFRYILAPLDKIPGLALSNRPLVHSYFNTTYRNSRRISLADPERVVFNDISVGDRCVVVRDLQVQVQ